MTYLKQICVDKAESVRVAIKAVQMIQMLQGTPGGCTDAMLTHLAEVGSKDYIDTIIPTLADLYGTATPEQAAHILSSVQRLFVDTQQQSSVRIAAGQALVQVGDPSSLPLLQEALLVEKEPAVADSLNDHRLKAGGLTCD